MKKTLLCVLIAALLLSLACCGEKPAPGVSEPPVTDAPATAAPTVEQTDAPEPTPAESEEPSSEPEPDPSASPSPSPSPTAVPVPETVGLGVSVDGFVTAYNAVTAGGDRDNAIVGYENAKSSTVGGYTLVTATIKVGGFSCQTIELYSTPKGLAQIRLLSTEPSAASGSDIAPDFTGSEATAQSASRIVEALGGKADKVLKGQDFSAAFTTESDGVSYDFDVLGVGAIFFAYPKGESRIA